MKNKHSYVPILKFKDAEVFAFRSLSEEQKKSITPLFQLVHQYWYENAKDKEGKAIKIRHQLSSLAVLQNVLTDVRNKLSDTKLFIDVSIMFPHAKEVAWKEIAESPVTLFGNMMIIVLTPEDILSSHPDKSVLEFFNKNGIALRVFKEDLTENFWESVDTSLTKLGLLRTNVDLILDYQLYDTDTADHVKEQLSNSSNMKGWRSLTVASGSFVVDLQGMKPGNHDLVRTDWLLWNELLANNYDLGETILGFGDYTIQYPIYSQSPEQVRGSRSVRYAKEDKWVIVKGQTDDAKNSAKTKQYLGHCLVLVNSGLHCGDNCCWGDRFISSISNKTNKKYGGLSTWLRVGFNHHLSLTTAQLASLGQISD